MTHHTITTKIAICALALITENISFAADSDDSDSGCCCFPGKSRESKRLIDKSSSQYPKGPTPLSADREPTTVSYSPTPTSKSTENDDHSDSSEKRKDTRQTPVQLFDNQMTEEGKIKYTQRLSELLMLKGPGAEALADAIQKLNEELGDPDMVIEFDAIVSQSIANSYKLTAIQKHQQTSKAGKKRAEIVTY